MKKVTLYKLVRRDRTTGGGKNLDGTSRPLVKWPRKGFSPPRLGGSRGLCSSTMYHAYDSPLLAVLNSPIHGDAADYVRCFEVLVAESDVVRDDGMKVGFLTGTLGKEVKLPEPTDEQCVRYAIGCAVQVYHRADFLRWANDWVSGRDRSVTSAAGRARAAWSAGRATRSKAAALAAEGAWSSAWSELAAESALAAAQSEAVEAWSALEASREQPLDLQRIAEWAMSDAPLAGILPDGVK